MYCYFFTKKKLLFDILNDLQEIVDSSKIFFHNFWLLPNKVTFSSEENFYFLEKFSDQNCFQLTKIIISRIKSIKFNALHSDWSENHQIYTMFHHYNSVNVLCRTNDAVNCCLYLFSQKTISHRSALFIIRSNVNTSCHFVFFFFSIASKFK